MGSEFLTYEEAASLLKKRKRTVRDYVRRGLLKKHIIDGEPRVTRGDVQALYIDSEKNFPAITRQSVFELALRIEKLEMDTALLKEMHGVNDKPLRPTVQDAKHLWDAASALLGKDVWIVQEVEQWQELLSRVDDVTFNMLCHATNDLHAWQPLFKLCLLLMEKVSTAPGYHTTLHLQALHKRLDEARKTMRSIILMRVELGEGITNESVLRALDPGYKVSVLRRIEGGKKA